MRWFKFMLKNILNYLKVCWPGRRPIRPCYTGCEFMWYEYDSGEKKFQEQLQSIYSKQELQKFYYCKSFGQTSENKLELELNFKKDKLLWYSKIFVCFFFFRFYT